MIMFPSLTLIATLLLISLNQGAELEEPSKELVNGTQQYEAIPEEVGRSSGSSAYATHSESTGYLSGHTVAVPVPITLKSSHVVLSSPPEKRQYTSGSLAAGLGGAGSFGLSSSYGAPSSSYGAPSSSYGVPSSSYGTPSSSYGTSSSSYEDFDEEEEDKGKVALIVLVSVLGGLLLLLLPGYKLLLLLAKALGLTTLVSLISTGAIPAIGREDLKSRSLEWPTSIFFEDSIKLLTSEEIWKKIEALTGGI